MSLALPLAENQPSTRGASVRFSGIAIVVSAAFLLALGAFAPMVLGDGDTWSHLATGEWILAHRSVPRVDPFSFSMAGAPWTAHEWLSEVAMALVFRVAGWSGVALLTGLAAGSAALIVGLRVARSLTGVALLAVALVGVGLLTANLLARPHVLALPLVAAWGAALLAARDEDRAPPIALAAVMILWSNLHGGFAFGLALIAPFALEALLAAPPERKLAIARDWGLFGLAAVLAALVNPYGLETLLFPFRLLGIENLSKISEWAPQDFSRLGPMELALLLTLGFALTRPVTLSLLRALILVGLVHLSLHHARHEMLLGLYGPMLLAGPIARAVGDDAAPALWPRVARYALIVASLAALVAGGIRLALPVKRVDGAASPISALNAVPPAVRERPVLNDYNVGGYLIWSGVRPFIDGRADMFGDAMLSRYAHIAGGDAAALEEALKRDAIAWTIFSPQKAVVALLDREPGWRRVYADEFVVVHVRDDVDPPGDGLRRE